MKDNEDAVPNTIKELKQWMKRECLNQITYSIGGKPAPFEGFVLHKKDEIFEWYYTERGTWRLLQTFENEKDVCRFAFEQMKKDEFAKTHLVGFFKSEKNQKDFCRELKNRNIQYKTDKIPYEIDSPRYRVFVFGCDYKKIADLIAEKEN